MPSTPTSSGPSSTSTTAGNPVSLHVYYLADGHLTTSRRTVGPTAAVATAAVRELLAGPSSSEAGAGLSTEVPSGTQLLGVSIRSGIATVNLSSAFSSGGTSQSEAARLAQVTFTLTQFPTVTGVLFEVEGSPVSTFGDSGLSVPRPANRTSFEALTPAIFVESPDIGDSVFSPIQVSGTANVFEATFQLELLDANGQSLTTVTVHASSGTGTRGTFSATLRYGITADEVGSLVAYDLSPKDGSRQDMVRIPLSLRAA
jgi:hypothetical protein